MELELKSRRPTLPVALGAGGGAGPRLQSDARGGRERASQVFLGNSTASPKLFLAKDVCLVFSFSFLIYVAP